MTEMNHAYIDIENTNGSMRVIENGFLVCYFIKVTDDRQSGNILRNVFDADGHCIGESVEKLTFDEIKNDPNRTELFRWFAHGVYGIPL